jgi:hypothetical protein
MAAVPPFTASLDAKVPSENVVLTHYIPELRKWYVVSQASDGHVFTGLGNTEPLGRRAAGLRTYEHLQKRAQGELPGLSPEDIEAARLELDAELEHLTRLVAGFNGSFPPTYAKEIILIELRAAKDLVEVNADRTILAKWVAPPLLFIAGAFAEGAIGVGAEKALDLLGKLLSG